jgi:hypothetical protein
VTEQGVAFTKARVRHNAALWDILKAFKADNHALELRRVMKTWLY